MRNKHYLTTCILLGIALFMAGHEKAFCITGELQQIETLISERKLTEAQEKISLINEESLGAEDKSFLLYQKAHIQYINKDYQRAMQILNDVIAQYPGTQKFARAKYLKSYTFLKLNDISSAKQGFKKFIEEHPDHDCAPDAALRHAYMVLREEKIPKQEVAPYFKDVFDKYPHSKEAANARLRYARITSIKSEKTVQEKKAAFEDVVNLCPGTPEAYEAQKSVASLAWLESEQEKSLVKKQQAEQIYKALEKEAKTEADKGYAAMHLAAINLEIERLLKEDDGDYEINYDLVKSLCDKALEITPESEKETRVTATLIKSECIYFSESWENAIQAFQDLLKKYSTEEKCQTQCAFAQYMLATTYLRKKDYEKAEEAFKKLLSVYSEAPNFKGNNVQAASGLHLGQMMSDQGRYDEATQHLQRVKQMYPETREARKAANMMAVVNSAKTGGMK